MAKTPYVGFSNELLGKLPDVKPHDLIRCPLCGQEHEIQPTDDGSFVVGLFNCGENVYLGAVKGKLVTSIKPTLSGKVDLETTL